jgi:phosphoserine aminotransferase
MAQEIKKVMNFAPGPAKLPEEVSNILVSFQFGFIL